jgi:hypothetical protein
MTRWLAFIISALICAAAWASIRSDPLLVDATMSKASEPASVVPWRLYSTCPVDHRNIPILKQGHDA